MGTSLTRSLLLLTLCVSCTALPTAADAQAGVPRVVCAEASATLWSGAHANAERMGVVVHQTPLTREEELGERSRVTFATLPIRTPVFIARDDVGAYALQTARVRGPSVSVRRGDLVCVRNEDAGDGRARILVQTRLGAGVRLDRSVGLEVDHAGRQRWVGTYPRSGLSADEPPWVDPYANAHAQRLAVAAGSSAEVFAATNGARILVVDAGATVPVVLVQTEGPWNAVRIGEGPFVVGFTQAALSDAAADARETARQQAMAIAMASLGPSEGPNQRFSNVIAGGPAVPSVLRTQEASQPLRVVRAGAALHIVGGEVLRTSRSITVRVGTVEPGTGRVRVLAALSDAIALYGTVSSADLLTSPSP